MSDSATCTFVVTTDGIVIVHHREYCGYIYDDECIWHNEIGPAVIWPDGHAAWWIDGINYTFNEWVTLVDLPDEEIFLLKMAYL